MPTPKEPYKSPYFDVAMQKSSEQGPGSANYPYTIEAKIADRKVEFNGMRHTNNPEDESLTRLETRFEEFLQQTDNPVVFVEGGMRDVANMSKQEVIKRFGEPGLLTKLALDRGIAVESPEPSFEQEVAELLKTFSAEDIMQYYFSRTLFQWYRNKDFDHSMGTAQDYINSSMQNRWSKMPGLTEVPCDYETLANNFAKKYGFKPEEMPDELAKDKLHHESSPFNPVSAASSDIRDKYIFNKIQEAAKQGRDVFLAFGSHHVFVYEQILEE